MYFYIPCLVTAVGPAIRLRSENITEIAVSGLSKLIMSGREGAIRIKEVGNSILPSSFNDGLMEETGIPVPSNRPISLSMIGFFFGK
jgi:hypothetical protein